MHIRNRTAMVTFNFIIGGLATAVVWVQFLSFGHDAWRLFATWVALISAIYYIVNALAALLRKRRSLGVEVCPMLQGGLIVSGITLLLIRIVCSVMEGQILGTDGSAMVAEIILPTLMIAAWAMFSRKGAWRAHDPFYWLALPVAYFAAILVSGEFMSRNARLTYPYGFLNYSEIGVDTMLWWVAIFAIIILVIGYTLWIIDFALSGKLSERVVMPKLKTVVVEEKPNHTNNIDEEPEEKPVRIVTTGSRNLPALEARATKKSQATKQAQSAHDEKKVQTNDTKSNSNKTVNVRTDKQYIIPTNKQNRAKADKQGSDVKAEDTKVNKQDSTSNNTKASNSNTKDNTRANVKSKLDTKDAKADAQQKSETKPDAQQKSKNNAEQSVNSTKQPTGDAKQSANNTEQSTSNTKQLIRANVKKPEKFTKSEKANQTEKTNNPEKTNKPEKSDDPKKSSSPQEIATADGEKPATPKTEDPIVTP